MTVRYHITVRGADGTLAGVSAEGEGDNVYAEFMAGVEDLSLQSQLTAASGRAAAAPAVATAAFPGAAVTTQQPAFPAQAPAQEPWGVPPVPPMDPWTASQQAVAQPPAGYQPPVPAAVAPAAQPIGGQPPFCQHGQKTFLTKVSQKTGKPWKAWACPAAQGDPSKCELDFIRG